MAQGFTRALADGVSYSLADLTESERNIAPEEFFIVVDRVIVRENTRTRIAEAVDGVLKLTHGELTLDNGGERRVYSTLPRCPDHGAGLMRPLLPEDFSPYSRTSACPECNGTGSIESKSADAGPGIARATEGGEECPKCHGLRLNKSILNAMILFSRDL